MFNFYQHRCAGSTLCENDALIVHDGIDASASVKKRICGKKSKIVIISRWRSLFVIFTSDNEFGAKGFQASFVEGMMLHYVVIAGLLPNKCLKNVLAV